MFDSDYLSPLKEEMQSPYFKLRVRENDRRQKYVVAYDGLIIKAVIMPMMIGPDYFKKLDSFIDAMNRIRYEF